MKISVSNIAIPSDSAYDFYEKIALCGANGIEIAPSKILPWDELSITACRNETKILKDLGLEVSSLQAIFFNKSSCLLLGDEKSFDAFCKHISFLGEISSALEAKVAVFGAPSTRKRENLSNSEANNIACERLSIVGNILSQTGLVLGIEPIPKIYGCDFLTSYNEVIDIVNKINSPYIRLHLDTACVMLGEGNIVDAIQEGKDVLCHFHASEPDLGDFDNPISFHDIASNALQKAHYKGWVALEMKEPSNNKQEKILNALNFVRSVYS
jgi:D-psicose/D-tagatose/L-ribulose 3-epimerase